MRDRRSYALNGLCFFENAKEHLEEDDFPEMPIGCIGGISGWHLCLDRISDGRMWYQPSIITNQTPQLQSRYYLDIVKNEGMINVPVVKRIVLNPSFGPLGPFISFDDLIDEKNGYLKFDGLIVEYGFQIEGMLDRDNIWTFNFDDRMFDCQKKANMISFYKDLENGGMKFFRCHKQLLTHHSTYFEFGLPGNRMIELNNEDLQYFDEFLQLSHGARIRQYDAFHGVCFFENAREHMEDDNFPDIPIGTIGGIEGWELSFDNTFFNRFEEEWLDEENGYLTNGGVLIEYGIQVEGIQSPEGVWTFNFHDRVFDCQEKWNMITFHKKKMACFHSHKQLLTFHSTYFDSDSNENQMIELTDEDPIEFENFLQVSHGVRKNYETLTLTLEYAQKYKMLNVIQLLDHAWKQMDWPISAAIYYKMNHCLAELLGKIESLEEMVEELKKVNLEKISGEAMKKCVKRFLEL
uniref:BTB domain-containing protein n=1 Tax=Caenorhabditis tropicalis TaxID=1561998 RepID=A0A1I7UKT5_9PELO